LKFTDIVDKAFASFSFKRLTCPAAIHPVPNLPNPSMRTVS
jgi:hypothetical protein